jgi:hypothetical protein
VNVNVPVNVNDVDLTKTERGQSDRIVPPSCEASIIGRWRSFTFTGTFTFT